MNNRRNTGFEIAVIGMAGRFPQASNIDEFWSNLKNGLEAISFFSDEELRKKGIDSSLIENPDYVKVKGGVLENKEYFDATFFEYTPREAEIMDPQFRVLHECSWHALEDAGYNPSTYQGSIGIYAGYSSNLFWKALTLFSGKEYQLGKFAADQLADKDFLCTRTAHKLNLKGPAVVVQTACSTSLVAIHMAARALLMRECDMALAGGVSISAEDDGGYLYQEGMIGARDGHCRAFDAAATGTIGGNGAGIVVLKRLKHALADGDHIRAVILGSSINNDGVRKVGYNAPSVDGQVDVIKTARHIAKIEPGSISYVETHGTGTILGDPVEVEALKQAFNTGKNNFCAIGSVKTNIGHLDAATGAAGFIKTVLALQHKQIPPSLNFEKPNPKIDFGNTPFYVNTVLKEWKNNGYPLIAGVSSFGIGGTNAHIILEEAPQPEQSSQSRENQMILISAKTQSSLDKATGNLKKFLKENPGIDLADVAYTLKLGRQACRYRRMLVCSDVPGAIAALSDPHCEKVRTFLTKKENPPVIFMFPGQGSQYINMAAGLYKTEPVFHEEMDRCFEILTPLMDYDSKKILYPPQVHNKSYRSNSSYIPDINQTEVTQPLLFAFEYALAKLLMKWGIKPYAMIGHSVGEYVAACLSGVFTPGDALKLVSSRGKLMQKMPHGSMLSVSLSESQLTPLLNNEISLAAVNAPSLCVVSGTDAAIRDFTGKLQAMGHESRLLHTSHAFHSKMMEPILTEFLQQVKQVKFNKPQIPYISNVTGSWITVAQAADPAYWVQHLRKTVQFSHGVNRLLEEKGIFLEIGPGKVLNTFVKQHSNKKIHPITLNLVRHPKEDISDEYYLSNKIGQLWTYGCNPGWSGYYSEEKRHRIPLPGYPFDKQRYWIEGNPFRMGAQMLSKSRLSKRKNIADWFYIPSWERSLVISQKSKQIHQQYCWLLFLDEFSLGHQMVKQLEQEKQNCITVKKGPGYKKVDQRTYTLNPRESQGYDDLFAELREKEMLPHKIVHLWGITGKISHEYEFQLQEMERILNSGFYSLINIVKAIGKQNIAAEMQIGVITNNIHNVTGKETIFPGTSAIIGPSQVIPREYSHIKCSCMDILLPEPGSCQEEKLTSQLINEFYSQLPGTVIAHRDNCRWVRTFTPVKLNEKPDSHITLKEKGVYLITGGLGGIGLVLGEHLAGSVKARLILTGRSAFPPREQWKEWIATHNSENPLSSKIRKIQKMESLGASVLALRADVSNIKQMHQVVQEGESRFGGKINGVIHAAGIVGGGTLHSIAELGQNVCQQQFNAKIYGPLVLEKILAERQLDFCLLTSSLASVLSGVGFSAYSAANIFMDTFAHHHNKISPVKWISVNWDGWDLQNQPGDLLITPPEGVDVFQRILNCREIDQIAVSTGDLFTRIDKRDKAESEIKGHDPATNDAPQYYSRPHLSTPYTAPTTHWERKIADAWQQFFGIEQVGIHDDFFELGGDSLKVIQLVKKLKEEGIDITLEKIFLHPTIKRICSQLQQQEDSISPAVIETIENDISKHLRCNVYHRVYQLDNGPYRVLYILHENPHTDDILRNIKEKVEDRYYPNFIKFIKSEAGIIDTQTTDPQLFSRQMELKTTLAKKEEQKILRQLNKNSPLTSLLKKNKITYEYNVSPGQRIALFNEETASRKVLLFSYDFTFPIDIERMKKIVIQLIKENSLLRSVIVKRYPDYFIAEFASFPNLEMPFIDLSNYSFHCKEKILNLIRGNLSRAFDVIDTLLYRLVALKLDNCNYQIIFSINHLIADGDSYRIFEDNMNRIITGKGHPAEEEKVKNGFYHYTKFLEKLNYRDIEVEKYLNVKDYIHCVKEVSTIFEIKKLKYGGLEIDVSNIKNGLKDFFTEVILLCFAKLLHSLFGVNKIPISFVSSGRIYKNGNFRNVWGDLHDTIPVLFPVNCQPGVTLEKFLYYRRFIKHSNLNFMNFIAKEYLKGNGSIKTLSSPFVFNLLIGFYDRLKNMSPAQELKLEKQEKDLNSRIFEMSIARDLNSDKSVIKFFQNSSFEIKELKEGFLSSYFDVLKDLENNFELKV